MSDRRKSVEFGTVKPLLDLLEQRFAIRLPTGPIDHLREVREHYCGKREMLLAEYGEAGAIAHADYAKAVMISEAARMLILREIEPTPRQRKKNKKDMNR